VNKEATDANKHQVVLGPVQEDGFEAPVLDSMINYQVDPIWKRYYTLEMFSKLQCEYRLGIGTTLLCLQNLQKRILGIKYINEAIRAVKQPYSQHRLMSNKDLILHLRELGVIGHVFGGSTHYQLVHRSQDLIRLFFNEKEIKESEIDMIWNVCSK